MHRRITRLLPARVPCLPALPALLALLVLAVLPGAQAQAQAQLARKPSFYEQGAGQAATPGAAASSVRSLPALPDRAAFDALARVYDAGTPMAMPHVLFAIDRRAAPPRMHYINTPRYMLHERFVREAGLAPRGGRMSANYLSDDRRFIFGTLAWQPGVQGFSYEFWEGDRITPALLRQADAMLRASFFAPLRLKANSSAQEARAAQAGIAALTQAELIGVQAFLPLNRGEAVGRLRIADSADAVRALRPDEIVVLREVPTSLPPVAGVVTERPSTVLSHVNLLAKGWGIPNAYLRDAAQQLRRWDGQWVRLSVRAQDWTVRAASEQERMAAPARERARLLVQPDLLRDALVPLGALAQRDSQRCGAKAANLGAVMGARIPGIRVPDGFCVPFAHYARFMQGHGLPERLARMAQQPGFDDDPQVRRTALAALRAQIEQWPVDPAVSAAWRARWQSQLSGQGVFVRSSSNSEDLANFSGAGLYTTVPNVKAADALEAAVRRVWASVFNFEAYEARRAAGIDHGTVVMGVLVQAAVDSTASGVMVTRDPFDAARRQVTYISAKRGVGIRVVEGQRIAEQVMYARRSRAVQVLNRSGDDRALQLDAAGGVREVPVEAGRAVLSDTVVERLAHAGDAIRCRFGGRDQDIEWALAGTDIVILQARPFVEARPR